MRDLTPLFYSLKTPMRLAAVVNMKTRTQEHPFCALAGGELAALVVEDVDTVGFAACTCDFHQIDIEDVYTKGRQ